MGILEPPTAMILDREPEPETPGSGRRRGLFLGAAVVVTILLGGLAFWLGSWGFEYRRQSLHNGRLRRLRERKPRMDQVVEGLRDEGSPLVASPADEGALRAEAAARGKSKAAEVIEKGGPQLRDLVRSFEEPAACADAIAAALVMEADARQELLENCDPMIRLQRTLGHVSRMLCELAPCDSAVN